MFSSLCVYVFIAYDVRLLASAEDKWKSGKPKSKGKKRARSPESSKDEDVGSDSEERSPHKKKPCTYYCSYVIVCIVVCP
jgi:hypothetical protein